MVSEGSCPSSTGSFFSYSRSPTKEGDYRVVAFNAANKSLQQCGEAPSHAMSADESVDQCGEAPSHDMAADESL